MSFVIALTINNQLYMASDSQATYEDGSISTNDYEKIKHFGSNKLIGFTGDLEICEKLWLTLNNSPIIPDKMNPYTTASIISKKMEELYKNKYDRNKRICKFIIGGVTNSTDSTVINQIKEYVIYTVESDDFQVIEKAVSKGNEIHYTFLRSKHISDNTVIKIIEDVFYNYKDTIPNVLKEIIRRISAHDKTVNSKVSIKTI